MENQSTLGILSAGHSLSQELVKKLAGRFQLKLFSRDVNKIKALYPDKACFACDLKSDQVRELSQDCDILLSFAHARFTENILKLRAPRVKKIIITGSTWAYTQLPNPAADEVRRAEDLLRQDGIDFTVIHPSMIYGTEEEKTISRLISWIQSYSLVPLPGGGKNLVQPAFVEDLVDTYYHSLTNLSQASRQSFVVAAHQSISYRELVEICARQQGKKVRVLSLPSPLLLGLSQALQWTPLHGKLRPDQVRRLMEDKNFDVSAGEKLIGRPFHSFEEGVSKL